jgi:hypothetical protein
LKPHHTEVNPVLLWVVTVAMTMMIATVGSVIVRNVTTCMSQVAGIMPTPSLKTVPDR